MAAVRIRAHELSNTDPELPTKLNVLINNLAGHRTF